jgi:hypothetical protein
MIGATGIAVDCSILLSSLLLLLLLSAPNNVYIASSITAVCADVVRNPALPTHVLLLQNTSNTLCIPATQQKSQLLAIISNIYIYIYIYITDLSFSVIEMQTRYTFALNVSICSDCNIICTPMFMCFQPNLRAWCSSLLQVSDAHCSSMDGKQHRIAQEQLIARTNVSEIISPVRRFVQRFQHWKFAAIYLTSSCCIALHGSSSIKVRACCMLFI